MNTQQTKWEIRSGQVYDAAVLGFDEFTNDDGTKGQCERGLVAVVYSGSGETMEDRQRLIAAAPELLYALQTARNGLLQIVPLYLSFANELRDVEAAIEKATGVAQ